ncbi:hypothetical protein F4778DRAFT_740967 [Xylariomycetidae sp. FL2044]|nr:hypothetical protein F4778DRAFT_740967 [Xylariomycetidae sp. FL2044]
MSRLTSYSNLVNVMLLVMAKQLCCTTIAPRLEPYLKGPTHIRYRDAEGEERTLNHHILSRGRGESNPISIYQFHPYIRPSIFFLYILQNGSSKHRHTFSLSSLFPPALIYQPTHHLHIFSMRKRKSDRK